MRTLRATSSLAPLASTIASFAAGAVTLALVGCPQPRDLDEGVPSGIPSGQPTPKSPWSMVGTAPKPPPSATVVREEPKLLPLLAGEPLARDRAPVEGEAFGVELLMEVRLRGLAQPPPHLGTPSAPAYLVHAASTGTLRVVVAAGRLRARIGSRTFALEEGWELRGDRQHAGLILVVPSATSPSYRIVPTGALRALLAERRADVMPLGPTHVVSLEPGTFLGRATTRVQITTSWGTVVLDQVAAPTSAKSSPVPKSDARATDADSENDVDGGGEPLCRAILELVAADAALGGPPCVDGAVPVRAEVTYAAGGGLLLVTTSLREGSVPRAELAFPPPSFRMSAEPLGAPPVTVVADELLAALQGKGETSSLDLRNDAPTPRVATIDGVPVALLPGGASRALPLRVGQHLLEWRTALGEAVEPPVEVDVPGSAVATQWVPLPPSSASPMASARKGP